jgi:opacity protein-like surface antigen
MARTRQGRNRPATRRRRYRLLLSLVTILAALAGPVVSRGEDATPASGRGKNEFGLWGGGSVAATPMIGKSTGFNFGLAALRYGRTLWKNGALAFDWTVDAIPVAILSLDRAPDSADKQRATVYGAGLAPIGFRIAYDALGWCRPYFAASGGFLAFTERVPATGSKFNFTYTFGVGAQVPVTADAAVTIGYTYYHISNGGIGESNPGFDSNILYAGFSIFR